MVVVHRFVASDKGMFHPLAKLGAEIFRERKPYILGCMVLLGEYQAVVVDGRRHGVFGEIGILYHVVSYKFCIIEEVIQRLFP